VSNSDSVLCSMTAIVVVVVVQAGFLFPLSVTILQQDLLIVAMQFLRAVSHSVGPHTESLYTAAGRQQK